MSTSDSTSVRLGSMDAYRGFVMLLMMAEVLHLGAVAASFPDSSFWQTAARHQTHVEWQGCTLHDLIQPSFSFLVGVALPFSLMNRRRRGQSFGRLALHAAWRAVVLVLLGVFLRSIGRSQTYYTFEDTLSQIGLGYFPLFLLGFARPRWQVTALVVILVGYWAAFAAYPLPPAHFDYAVPGVPSDWPHQLSGFAAHWNKNSNFASAADQWLLNLFPRKTPFTHNAGGYATLSFIPTLATMILGLLAGNLLLLPLFAWNKVLRLGIAGVACLAMGYGADYFGICPSVKRIWTPAWTLFSGGWCFLFLALFFLVIDLWRIAAWSYPLRVIGRNSIAAYCMAHLFHDFTVSAFHTHLGDDFFRRWGDAYEPLFMGAAVLSVFWLILFWMDRRKILIRI